MYAKYLQILYIVSKCYELNSSCKAFLCHRIGKLKYYIFISVVSGLLVRLQVALRKLALQKLELLNHIVVFLRQVFEVGILLNELQVFLMQLLRLHLVFASEHVDFVQCDFHLLLQVVRNSLQLAVFCLLHVQLFVKLLLLKLHPFVLLIY